MQVVGSVGQVGRHKSRGDIWYVVSRFLLTRAMRIYTNLLDLGSWDDRVTPLVIQVDACRDSSRGCALYITLLILLHFSPQTNSFSPQHRIILPWGSYNFAYQPSPRTSMALRSVNPCFETPIITSFPNNLLNNPPFTYSIARVSRHRCLDLPTLVLRQPRIRL